MLYSYLILLIMLISSNLYAATNTVAPNELVSMPSAHQNAAAKELVNTMLKNLHETPEIKAIAQQSQHVIQQTYQVNSHSDVSDPQLYYFVSFSMPDAILKSYMLDAIWNGGVLVIRGIPRGMTLSQFLQQFIMPLVQYKGAHAKIEINPNLFEMYDVNIVPTMLVTDGKQNESQCEKISSTTKEKYSICQAADPKSYWKISGNVTTRFALNALKDAGAPVDQFIARMKGLNKSAEKQEKGFEGDWEKAPMPITNDFIQDLLAKYGLQQTTDGAMTRKEDANKT